MKPDGSLYVEGDKMYRKTLAYTLEIIADSQGMYNDTLARLIVLDLNDAGKLTR